MTPNDISCSRILEAIGELNVKATFMHVCGTHQDTVVKYGLDEALLGKGIKVIQGPGCPVCVSTPEEIEVLIELALHGATITTFGDMVRVPGSSKSLMDISAEGGDVRVVYSITDAIDIAKAIYEGKDRSRVTKKANFSKHISNTKNNEDSNIQQNILPLTGQVVFAAIGFETTAPATASAIIAGDCAGTIPPNFSVFCMHKTVPNALKFIAASGELKIDGFIQPGHVSVIIGRRPYLFITEEYGLPQVISGFEPEEVLMSCYLLARMHKEKKKELVNNYKQVVSEEGNRKAQEAMWKVFEEVDGKWRGFPVIHKSCLKIKNEYSSYDAIKRYQDVLKGVLSGKFREPDGCGCGEVLRGIKTPRECPLFGTACTPANPVGPCMVSFEGSCQIEYKYRKNIKGRDRKLDCE